VAKGLLPIQRHCRSGSPSAWRPPPALPQGHPLLGAVASPSGGDSLSSQYRVPSPSGGDSLPGGAHALDPPPLIVAAIPDAENAVPLGADVVSPSLADIAQASELLETALQDLTDAGISPPPVPTNGTPRLHAPTTVALLDSGASISIMNPRYDTLFLPMALHDGTIHYQPFLVNRHATNTIISPENVLNNNHRFHQ
jgi:hypothetical protein